MAAIKRKTLTAEHYSRFKLSIFNFQLVIAVFLYLPNPQILAFFVLKAQNCLKYRRKKRPLFDPSVNSDILLFLTYLLHPRFGAYAATLEDAALNKRIADLLTTGKTSVVKGFISKSGKTFDAALKSDEGYQIVFDFLGKRKQEKEKSNNFAAKIHSRNGSILFH